ncbi:eggshell protein 2A-like [Panicum miliaceum]|uniref:Eggshell protein 2A-like n=1 Tax=Panicum miliaceum TaxID=4540 RepID=A0A3L6T4A7_PANMI|nr:eggshell protein 2A-like [Panicum miliaceum]
MSPTKTGVAVLLGLLALSAAPLASWAAGQGRPNPGWFGGGGPGPGAGFFGGWGEGGVGVGVGVGYRRGAPVPPSMVCAEQGPCRGKRLTCPARCFRSFSYKGKNGGGGGGGGGCSFDCASRCVATC